MTEDANAGVENLPPPRPALDGVARSQRALLCLLPIVGALAWNQHRPAWMVFCALALVLALVPRSTRPRPATTALHLYLQLLLMVLWLPPAAAWTRALAIVIAVVLALAWRHRDAANPFHPMMTACAIALLIAPATAAIAPIHANLLLAAACALGGIALLGLRAIRWQAPLGLLGGAGLAYAIGTALTGATYTDPMILALLPPVLLAAFFIADDPPRTCMQPRARLLCGALIGAIAATAIVALHAAHHDDRLLPALAGAVLLGNAAAPALDRWLTPPRRARTSSP
ncbi:MAG: RnfABCDGE type electron transport complex subunit D [Proteobacteria bacterium]|nr:RnfABCDGE type electron transport complex subunit D [Pseudomonadota bacterium]MBS0464094.1 RnfABCDGE type electron transport complex subunit D [Pseudomonadota bacterium]